MKKTFLYILIALGSFVYSQTPLENKYKIEAGFHGINIGTEIPLNNFFLADINLGWGGIYDLSGDDFSYEWSDKNSGYFVKGELRYYVSRKRRENKGHTLKNNSGSFVAFQSKYIFKENANFSGKVWMNEFHFGQQFALDKHFIFRYHIGLGVARDVDYNYNSAYLAAGLILGYTF